MVGKSHIRDIEIIDPDTGTVQDEVDFTRRTVTGMGRHIGDVGAFEVRRGKKQLDLPFAEKGIEITSYNHFLFGLLDKCVQVFELVLAMAVFQGKMDKKYNCLIEFCLDDEALDALFKIVEGVVVNFCLREQGV